MNKNQIIRIFLTATILMLGGYYIQQSSNTSSNQDSIGEVSADAIPVVVSGGSGGK